MIKEENRLGERLKRYTAVSTQMGGVLLRLFKGKLFPYDGNHQFHAEDFRKALGELKGPLMKIAQLLATVPDLLPAPYTEELMQLQSQAPSMGPYFVKRRMASELGPLWQQNFSHFDLVATAAASLGQVHQATGPDHQKWACKLQYPDMSSAVEADLGQLNLLMRLYETFDRAVDTSEIREEIGDRLREELNYLLEAKHIQLYALMLKPYPQIHVPQVIEHLTTKRLITMTWLKGEKLLKIKNWPLEMRNQVAQNMFRAWYAPFYHYGIIHGDPHLGNYSVCANGDINLIDFGCVRKFEAPFIKGVIDLYYALQQKNNDLAAESYRSWGFKNLSHDLIEILNKWALYLYGPILEDRVRPIDNNHSAAYGVNVAAKIHEELKKIGGVRPPKPFVFMDRAAIGLGSVFMHLQSQLNWHDLFHDLIDNFSVEMVQKNQAQAFQKSDLI